MAKLLTRKERCLDCPCLASKPECDYYCDEYDKPCEEIEICGEWEKDPSVDSTAECLKN